MKTLSSADTSASTRAPSEGSPRHPDLALALSVLRHAGSPNRLLDCLESFQAAHGVPHILAKYHERLARFDAEPRAVRALAELDEGLLAAAMKALDHATVLRHLDRVILERRPVLLRTYSADAIEDLLSNER